MYSKHAHLQFPSQKEGDTLIDLQLEKKRLQSISICSTGCILPHNTVSLNQIKHTLRVHSKMKKSNILENGNFPSISNELGKSNKVYKINCSRKDPGLGCSQNQD